MNVGICDTLPCLLFGSDFSMSATDLTSMGCSLKPLALMLQTSIFKGFVCFNSSLIIVPFELKC